MPALVRREAYPITIMSLDQMPKVVRGRLEEIRSQSTLTAGQIGVFRHLVDGDTTYVVWFNRAGTVGQCINTVSATFRQARVQDWTDHFESSMWHAGGFSIGTILSGCAAAVLLNVQAAPLAILAALVVCAVALIITCINGSEAWDAYSEIAKWGVCPAEDYITKNSPPDREIAWNLHVQG